MARSIIIILYDFYSGHVPVVFSRILISSRCERRKSWINYSPIFLNAKAVIQLIPCDFHDNCYNWATYVIVLFVEPTIGDVKI
jgi:hypothetical protein